MGGGPVRRCSQAITGDVAKVLALLAASHGEAVAYMNPLTPHEGSVSHHGERWPVSVEDALGEDGSLCAIFEGPNRERNLWAPKYHLT